MDLWRSLSGIVQIEITTADPAATLQRINRNNIRLFNIDYEDDFTVKINVGRTDLPAIKKILHKAGEKFCIKRKVGLFWYCKSLWRRPVFWIGILVLTALTLGLSSRIFFVQVEGNARLADSIILERAEECGIYFGASRRQVRSEKMKNALLSSIPELEWAGINTSGCFATIRVKEKEQSETQAEDSGTVSSIVAARDGIIVSSTVYSGNPLCTVGQAVKAGQTLVSAYTDCGLLIRATAADAEIMARTFRTAKVISPVIDLEREEKTAVEKKYGLLIGKKLINFYKDSGICDTTCVKMYKENYMTLPGGLQIPVALVTEEWIYYNVSTAEQDEDLDYTWLEKYGRDYVFNQMVSGQLLSESSSLHSMDGIYCLEGRYTCLEMIGQVRNEENIYSYGEYNRENR